jgi:hypothetical protein
MKTMPTGIEQLQAELGERYAKKTKDEYIRVAGLFFTSAGDKPSYERHEFLAYFDSLLKAGRGQGTLDMAWFTCKAICRAKNIPFPCREGFKGDQPKVRKISLQEISVDGESYTICGPTPEYQQIADLIAWVKANGDDREKAYLALSTIYAMRAIEISTINKREDIKENRIFCRTAKGGQPKWHEIPQEVLDYIKGYKYPEVAESVIWSTFRSMRKRAGFSVETPLTPHGIRRWLDTFYTSRPDFNVYIWSDFARWSRKRGDMPGRYRHASSAEVDRPVFAIHPLLPLWGGTPAKKGKK